jgi:hypothetical protein
MTEWERTHDEVAKMAARQLRDLADQLEEGKLRISNWTIETATGRLASPFFLGGLSTRIEIYVKKEDQP